MILAAIPLFLLLLGHVIAGGFPAQWGEAVHGRVIEEQTGQPLPGVLVVGRWYTNGIDGEDLMHASEALTDARGQYHLPGMPWKIRPPFDHYDQRSPEIMVYKPGFGVNTVNEVPRGRFGFQTGRWVVGPKIVSYWNSKDIPLPPASTPESEAKALDLVHSYASGLWTIEGPTNPRRMPLLWETLIAGYRRLPPGTELADGNPEDDVEYWTKERK